jgi:hypothetical protein
VQDGKIIIPKNSINSMSIAFSSQQDVMIAINSISKVKMWSNNGTFIMEQTLYCSAHFLTDGSLVYCDSNQVRIQKCWSNEFVNKMHRKKFANSFIVLPDGRFILGWEDQSFDICSSDDKDPILLEGNFSLQNPCFSVHPNGDISCFGKNRFFIWDSNGNLKVQHPNTNFHVIQGEEIISNIAWDKKSYMIASNRAMYLIEITDSEVIKQVLKRKREDLPSHIQLLGSDGSEEEPIEQLTKKQKTNESKEAPF